MTSDTPISESELVVLACASSPVPEQELLKRVRAAWVSSAPLPSTSTWFESLMAVREAGLLDSLDPQVFQTSPRGHRLLQRALCGALGAPRPSHPGAMSFPQAMSLAVLLPVPTLLTVLRTRRDALDREQRSLAVALRAAHEQGGGALRVAALNLREGLLNAERAFLFTFVGDVEKGFVSWDATLPSSPATDGVVALRA